MINSYNRGIGAGGLNTTKNGLGFEHKTELNFKIIDRTDICEYVRIPQCNTLFLRPIKFHRCMLENGFRQHDIKTEHGCSNPDDCIIDDDRKIIYWIEKMFQVLFAKKSKGCYVRKKILQNNFQRLQ